MITPELLKEGDTIALVATARKNLEDNLQPAIDLARSWGLKIIVGKTIGLDNNQLAGTDEQRATDLQTMLDDPNIKAIWCVRGGYGTVRIIDALDFTAFMKNPKWIIGFSDVTVLHSELNRINVKSIHAVMCTSVVKATLEATESLRKALFGEKIVYDIEPFELNKVGRAEGELVGGNLSIIYSLLGSKSALECENKILFIEDLDEYLYHIDRMLINIKRNGYFDNLNGLIVGAMTDMKDNNIHWGRDALEIIAEITEEYDFPVMYNFPAGHVEDNRTLIVGGNVCMNVTHTWCGLVFE